MYVYKQTQASQYDVQMVKLKGSWKNCLDILISC